MLDQILRDVHERVEPDRGGRVASYIPALESVDPDTFGLAMVTADGEVHKAGDADVPFSIQSVSKPFTFALALNRCGHEATYVKVGTEPSGDAFDSIVLHPNSGLPSNPMVNAGAIAMSGLLLERYGDEAFEAIHHEYGRFAGSELGFDETVYRSEMEHGHHNLAIAHLLAHNGVIERPLETVELYTRQCAQTVTATQLATMAATLANVGTNPHTRDNIVDPLSVRHVLSLMFTCGMYDYAGHWAVDVGIPAKSGVGGGVMAVVNRQLGIGLYSPRLDEQGNSVRAIHACERLAEELGLHAFEFSNAGSSLLGVYLPQKR